jgi:hypothetical protein
MKPFGVAIDVDGNVWVNDNRSDTISVILPKGRLIETLPSTYQGKTVLSQPVGTTTMPRADGRKLRLFACTRGRSARKTHWQRETDSNPRSPVGDSISRPLDRAFRARPFPRVEVSSAREGKGSNPASRRNSKEAAPHGD